MGTPVYDDRGIKLSSGFNLRTAIPLDLRTTRKTTVDRDSIPIEYRYEGMPCYVEEGTTLWRLKGGVQDIHWVKECCRKYNLMATEDPKVSNNADAGEDYTEGSLWRNQLTDDVFLLTNFTGANANWLRISGDFNWTNVIW